jgi:hypothetical protein
MAPNWKEESSEPNPDVTDTSVDQDFHRDEISRKSIV